MSQHPNAILLLRLIPQALARKTMADILGKPFVRGESDVKIDGTEYHSLIMETEFDEGFQITTHEGDLVFFTYITYGYGESITWSHLSAMQLALKTWAMAQCKTHHCTHEILITTNYW